MYRVSPTSGVMGKAWTHGAEQLPAKRVIRKNLQHGQHMAYKTAPAAGQEAQTGAEAVADTLQAADIYTLLAQLMRYPEEADTLALLLDAQQQLAAALAWHEDARALEAWRARCPDICGDLRLEYTRLFITAARRSTVPPYASVYLDAEGLLQGRSTERIHDFYRACGYELAALHEPADHIVLQLDFLAALAREHRDGEEEAFLRTWFRPWFVPFMEKCLQQTAHPVYRVALTLIDFFTKEEE